MAGGSGDLSRAAGAVRSGLHQIHKRHERRRSGGERDRPVTPTPPRPLPRRIAPAPARRSGAIQERRCTRASRVSRSRATFATRRRRSQDAPSPPLRSAQRMATHQASECSRADRSGCPAVAGSSPAEDGRPGCRKPEISIETRREDRHSGDRGQPSRRRDVSSRPDGCGPEQLKEQAHEQTGGGVAQHHAGHTAGD